MNPGRFTGRIVVLSMQTPTNPRLVVEGDLTGANPTDRGKTESQAHVAGEAGELPIAVIVSAATRTPRTRPCWRQW